MIKVPSLPNTWALGLSEEQQQQLSRILHQETTIQFWTEADIPSVADQEKDAPCLLWLSSKSLKKLQSLPPAQKRHLELVPKVLLLDKFYSINDFEEASDLGIAEIVRPPFTSQRLRAVLLRAIEVNNIHDDMLCMTREIMLEREILQRKNDVLSFLVNFLSSTTDCFHMENILEKAFSTLGMLFPVKSLHAALWHDTEDRGRVVSLYINAPANSKAHTMWKNSLLEQTALTSKKEIAIEEIHSLLMPGQKKEYKTLLPSECNPVTLPISIGGEQQGALLILTDMNQNLGRDQATALDSAINHLALSINNARQFRMMQLQADYDVLSGVHSRRHFELRLDEEFERYTRYEQPLSAIMLDIDHFKQINDRFGHLGGDKVLKEIGTILQQSARSTDYCARYGGEEFVILLTHTDHSHALAYAERVRKSIEKHTFTFGDEAFKVTASLGVSSLENCTRHTKESLIQEADEALYRAKHEGRNCSRDLMARHQKKIA